MNLFAPALPRLEGTLPPGVRLGTSSWSFPGWCGIVWDVDRSAAWFARHGLAHYARHRHLRTVGVDRTYYAPVTEVVFASYAAQVPDDFRFLVKAHELCTSARTPSHARHGSAAGGPNPRFLDPAYARDVVVAPFTIGLGAKAGPLLFQFSPQAPSTFGGPAAFAERLHRFLDALPRGPLYAVEIRTAALLGRPYADALAATGACHAFTVHPTMPELAAQAAVVDVARMPALVVRWMLGHGQGYEAARERYSPFDRLVDEDPTSRAAIADLIRGAVARRRDAYSIINNKAEGSAPLSALRLAALLASG